MKRILVPLCILMAMLILIISMTTVSFSWFEPSTKEGIGLEFKETTTLRSESCTIATYEGSLGNSIVIYGTNAIGGEAVTVNEGSVKYYKTVITNSSADYDTVVSLYLPTFNVNGGKASIGVAYPTNSYRTFSSTQTDIHIIRNASVPKLVTTDENPGEIAVEWFVKCDVGSVEFNPSQVFLMYS